MQKSSGDHFMTCGHGKFWSLLMTLPALPRTLSFEDETRCVFIRLDARAAFMKTFVTSSVSGCQGAQPQYSMYCCENGTPSLAHGAMMAASSYSSTRVALLVLAPKVQATRPRTFFPMFVSYPQQQNLSEVFVLQPFKRGLGRKHPQRRR